MDGGEFVWLGRNEKSFFKKKGKRKKAFDQAE